MTMDENNSSDTAMPSVHAECRRMVASYLRDNGFDDTLAAFEAEARAKAPAATAATADTSAGPSKSTRGDGSSNAPLELQQLVERYLQEEALAAKLASTRLTTSSLGTAEHAAPFDWHRELSSTSLPKQITRTLRDVHLSGVLSVGYCRLPRRIFDTASAIYRSEHVPCIVTSSTDKRIVFTSIHSWAIEDGYEPVKSVTLAVRLSARYPYLVLSGAMDGSCTVTNLLTRESVVFREHSNVVRVAWSNDGRWFCSAGYDRQLCLYEVTAETLPPSQRDSLDDDEFANIPTFKYECRWRRTLPTNPEACLFLPDSSHLVFTRRDDNHLNYVALPNGDPSGSEGTYEDDFKITSYNLNENLDAHISFSILSLAVHPSQQALSLQTDTATSRILLLPFHSTKRLRETLFTNAEQSPFSNPRHAWLDDGTGVAVSSDDGIVRIVGLDGKVKASYGAHGVAAPPEEREEAARGSLIRSRYESDKGSSVVRDLCVLPGNVVVSVGLDKTVRVAEPVN